MAYRSKAYRICGFWRNSDKINMGIMNTHLRLGR